MGAASWGVIAFAATVLGAAACVPSPPQQRNKATVRRLYDDVLSRGRWDVYEQIHAPDFVAHAGRRTETRAEDLESAKGWRQAIPDVVVVVDQILADGDLVAVRWTGRGTNTGKANGLPGTGKHVEINGTTVFRLANDRIAEEWNTIDELGLLRQLGMLR